MLRILLCCVMIGGALASVFGVDCQTYKARLAEGAEKQNWTEIARDLERLQKENPDDACVAFALGWSYLVLREHQKAKASYEASIRLARQAHDSERELEGTVELAVLYLQYGSPDRALQCLNDALALSRAIRRPDLESEVQIRMAEALQDLGELAEAEQRGRAGLDLRRALHDARVWYAYQTLGDIHTALGDRADTLARAQQEYGQAVQYYTQAGLAARKPRHQKMLMISLAEAYLKSGDWEAAWLHCRSFLDSAPEADTILVEGRSRALGHIGEIAWRRHHDEAALLYLHRAVELARKDKSKRLEMSWLKTIGDIYAEMGRYDDARQYYDQVLQEAKDGFWQLGSDTREEGYVFFEDESRVYEAIIGLLLKMDAQHPDRGYARAAFDYAERARSQSMLQTLFQSRVVEKLLAGGDKGTAVAFRRTLAGLQEDVTRKHQAKLRLLARKAQTPDDPLLEDEVRALEVDIDRLYKRIAGLVRQKIRDYDNPAGLVDQIQQRDLLQADEALIEYLVGDEQTYVFVITRTAFHYAVLPLGRKGYAPAPDGAMRAVPSLPQLVQRVSPLFSLHRDPAAARPRIDDLWANVQLPALQALYAAVFQPIERYLRPGAPLRIVPDDALYYVPFEMLVTGLDAPHPPQFLLARYPVAYAYTAGSWLDVPPAIDGPPAALLIANPDFGRPPRGSAVMADGAEPARLFGGRLLPLPFAEEEVYRSRKFLRRPTTRVGRQATEAAFKREGARATILHVATHSFFDPRNYLDSKILFALDRSIDQQGEDGVLYLHEIMNLRLAARLVVLSGCETGVGRLRRGSGLEGLSRAFLSAGVPSVMGTLWPVLDSEAMPKLMSAFYQYLGQGLDKRDALRKAKLDLIAQGVYTDPFYWAPLVLIGDTHGLPQIRGGSGGWRWLGGGLLIALAPLAYWARRRFRVRRRAGSGAR